MLCRIRVTNVRIVFASNLLRIQSHNTVIIFVVYNVTKNYTTKIHMQVVINLLLLVCVRETKLIHFGSSTYFVYKITTVNVTQMYVYMKTTSDEPTDLLRTQRMTASRWLNATAVRAIPVSFDATFPKRPSEYPHKLTLPETGLPKLHICLWQYGSTCICFYAIIFESQGKVLDLQAQKTEFNVK